ncbi:MAG: hypothetical protein JSU94_06080 [Phycisphaerales bacterium]|nr:MAG: hypothetical protein JSU94_06080 [Phycisphaerales bacterium]
MRKNRLAWQRATCILACLLWSGAAGQEVGDFEELTFEIATGVREILPIEPLPITFTLSNNSERPIKAHSAIRPGYGFVRLYIASENGPFERFYSSDDACISLIGKEDVLKPGFRDSVSTYVFYAQPRNLDKENVGKYLMESPGTYRLKAEFANGRDERTIESNTLTIRAAEPTGQNAAAYRFLKNLQRSEREDVYYGSFLLHPPDRAKELAKQEEFVRRFPRSRYTRYIHYAWGQRYRS